MQTMAFFKYTDRHTNISETSQTVIWKNGIQNRTTLYFGVIVAGEQTRRLRLSVHPVKSIIV